MIKIDPIIAVRDVNESAKWYQSVFECRRKHGGPDIAVLEDSNGEIMICLHKWGEHDHPTMTHPTSNPGNGLILYFKTDHLEAIRHNLINMKYPIEKDIHFNANSRKQEFSLRDPDGYYITITEYHRNEG